MKYNPQYTSPLGEKLQSTSKPLISFNLCAWSDLLGFSSHFTKKNWILSQTEWEIITKRLDTFYKCHSKNFTNLFNEYMFVLNDGVIRTYFPSKISHSNAANIFHEVELWFRNIVISHISICELEISNGLPGVRTVIAFGEKAKYSFSEVRVDDLVFNYTRPKEGFSKIAQITGNPILINNPEPLQMNTALAKAYILESFGSKKGIEGASLYIDESVLSFLDNLVAMTDMISININNTDEGRVISYEYTENFKRPWAFGLLLGDPILVMEKAITTKVYKVQAFYPNDEHPDEFRFDLINLNNNRKDTFDE